MDASSRPNTYKAARLLLMLVVVCSSSMFAVDSAVPSSVDVYWKSTRTIVAPGATGVVILDEDIAHAEIGNDTIEFAGLSRGETVALAYVNGNPVSIVVHVIERPANIIPPSLMRREGELAHGTYGSDFQISTSGGEPNFVLLNNFTWSQQIVDHRLDINSQIEDNSQFGGHEANLQTGSVMYRTPHFGLNLLDFSQSLTGSVNDDYINNFSSLGAVQLRGASVEFDSAKNRYSVFAGSTIPYYFLSLNATRDAAGLAFHRKQTERLSLFAGTSYVNIPTTFASGIERRSYVMQNAGFTYRIGKDLRVGAQGGISNRGGLVRADASYSSYRLSGYGTVIFAAQSFPLYQLQSLFSGTSTAKGQIAYRTTSHITQGIYIEHTDVSPGLIYPFKGSSDYISPNFGYLFSNKESFNFTYTYSRNTGGFASTTTTGNRYDASLSSQLAPNIANHAQVTIGSVQDPLQISSEDQFSARDSISLPVKGQTLLLGVEQDRVQPSLVTKLSQELSLLSPALQTQFEANPIAFIDSSNFPPEIKALLAAEQPTGTTVSAAANIALGAKLRFNPNFSLTHSDDGAQSRSWTQGFGYSVSYQLRPTLQLRSFLNNVLVWDSRVNSVARTWVLSVGFQKSFSTAPGELPLLHRGRVIEGRVFRDNNINGAYNAGEPGLARVEVHLDDGQVAITDELGRYKFSSVSADQHEVSIALTQFRNPVRMTTRSEVEADLIQQRIAIVNFGLLDFARLMGNVYNDLRFENRKQPDSIGMRDIDLLLDNGKEVRKIETAGSGDFELDNVAPGDYKLSLDPASIPANYLGPTDSIAIHVSPVSTVVQDIPLRALRSISGRVLLKTASAPKTGPGDSIPTKLHGKGGSPAAKSPADVNQGFALTPVAGVQIIAGPATTTTDNEGNFLLRNLPAGDLKVTIRPVRDVPDGIEIPSGHVKMPPEPIQVQGATVVITNPELLPYLTREFPPVPGMKLDTTAASVKTHQPTINAHAKPQVAVSVLPPVSTPVKAEVTQSQASNAVSSKPAVSAASSASSEPTPAVELAKVPNVAPSAPATSVAASAAPAATPNANKSAQAQAAVEWTLTRAACEAFQSLGEKAQCFRQLKAMSTSSPR